MRLTFVLCALSVNSLVISTSQQPLDLVRSEEPEISNLKAGDSKHYVQIHSHGSPKQHDCTVHIAEAFTRVHEGYTRRGIYFWAYGTVVEDYCKFWQDHFYIGESFPFFQPSCRLDSSQSVHRVDTSWFNDDDVEETFQRAKGRSLEWWIEYAGCEAGGNEFVAANARDRARPRPKLRLVD